MHIYPEEKTCLKMAVFAAETVFFECFWKVKNVSSEEIRGNAHLFRVKPYFFRRNNYLLGRNAHLFRRYTHL